MCCFLITSTILKFQIIYFKGFMTVLLHIFLMHHNKYIIWCRLPKHDKTNVSDEQKPTSHLSKVRQKNTKINNANQTVKLHHLACVESTICGIYNLIYVLQSLTDPRSLASSGSLQQYRVVETRKPRKASTFGKLLIISLVILSFSIKCNTICLFSPSNNKKKITWFTKCVRLKKERWEQ